MFSTFFEYVICYSFTGIRDFLIGGGQLFSKLEGLHKVKSNDAVVNKGLRLHYFQETHCKKIVYKILSLT